MVLTLKHNERLICSGTTEFRGADGALVNNVPQYKVITVNENNKDEMSIESITLAENERLVKIGNELNSRASAKERYAAALRGEKVRPIVDGNPIYIKVDKSASGETSGIAEDDERYYREFASVIASMFERYMGGQANS